MATVTPPHPFTGKHPVNLGTLPDIHGTDPNYYAVTKVQDYNAGGPANSIFGDKSYQYFGTGDIAKLQSSVLLLNTSGLWNNPDIIAGGETPNPTFNAFVTNYTSCLCANGGHINGFPAKWVISPSFMKGGTVSVNMPFGMGTTISECFTDLDELKVYITTPKSDGGVGITPNISNPSTSFYTNEKNVVGAINEIVGATGLPSENKANFKYTATQIDQIVSTIVQHFGPVYTSTDYARIKHKIGLAPTIPDAYFEGNVYSGLELNYDAHKNFVDGFNAISGNITYTTGSQLIIGPKAFQKYTTFNTGVAISGDALISGGLTVNNPSTFNSEVAVSGDTIISGGLTVNKHAVFNSGVTVNSGDLTINSGNLNMSGNLNVTGNSYLSGELWILGSEGPCRVACSGNSIFDDGITINNSDLTINNGNLNMSGDLNVTGNLNMSGDLNVTGNSYLSGELWILGPNGPCQVACSGDGGITVEGDTTNFNSTNVNISGDTLISGGLTVNKHATFNSGVTVNSGDLTLNSGNLNMSGDLNLTGNAYVSGQLWILGPDGEPCKVACSGAGGITVEGDTTNFNSTNVNISGDTLISGGLTVNKHATFNSGVTVNSGDLTLNSGNLNMSGDLNLTGNAYVSGQLWILGPDGEPCRVACSGESSTDTFISYVTFNSGVSISGDTIISGGLTVNNHATFNSGVTVNSGDLTLNSGNLNMSGDLNLTGNAYISGQLWILGSDGAPCRVACSGEGGTASPLTTKGDLWGYDSDDARLPVGSPTQVLVANPNTSLGVNWTSPCYALTGCHVYAQGDKFISEPSQFGGLVKIAQYDSLGALTDSLGSSMGSYSFGTLVGTISGANLMSQVNELLIGGYSNSMTGYIGQHNIAIGGSMNMVENASAGGSLDWQPGWNSIIGGTLNKVTGHGLHAGLILGGISNQILAKTTIGNTDRDGSFSASSGPGFEAGYNTILGGSTNLITQTVASTDPAYSLLNIDTYGNTIIGAKLAQIKNQNQTVFIQAGSRGSYVRPHTGDGTLTERGRTMTLSAANGIFASGNLYVTGAGNSWIRITGGAGGGGGLTSPLTTKGDLWGYDTDNARLPVGSDGQVLIADAGAALGVKWGDGGSTVEGDTTNFNSTNVNISGDTLISGGLTVNKHATFNSGVTVNSGDLTLNSGNLNMSGDLNLTGNAYVSGQLWILGPDGEPCRVACSGDSANFNQYTTFNSGVAISGDTIISGGLTVNNHATFNSGVSISGDLNVTGNSYLSGELWILGPDGKPCRVACSGDSANFNQYTTFNSGVAISGDTIISGNLTVTGSTQLGLTNITGDLGVSGCIKSYQCVTDSTAASYTLSASDFGKIVHYNPASDAVFNLPATASVPTIADGWQATVMNISSNKITLTPLGGLVLKSDGTIIAGQYQAATVYYQGGDWYAAGALSS